MWHLWLLALLFCFISVPYSCVMGCGLNLRKTSLLWPCFRDSCLNLDIWLDRPALFFIVLWKHWSQTTGVLSGLLAAILPSSSSCSSLTSLWSADRLLIAGAPGVALPLLAILLCWTLVDFLSRCLVTKVTTFQVLQIVGNWLEFWGMLYRS